MKTADNRYTFTASKEEGNSKENYFKIMLQSVNSSLKAETFNFREINEKQPLYGTKKYAEISNNEAVLLYGNGQKPYIYKFSPIIANGTMASYVDEALSRHLPAASANSKFAVSYTHLDVYKRQGLMWPKIEYPSDGLMLAASHAIGRNAVIDEEVAVFLAGLLLVRYPALLSSRYGFVLDGVDAVAVVEGVAKKRSLILRGGGPDFEKASAVLVQDYREGKLGRISLETPETRRMMIGATNETPTLSTGPSHCATVPGFWAYRLRLEMCIRDRPEQSLCATVAAVQPG